MTLQVRAQSVESTSAPATTVSGASLGDTAAAGETKTSLGEVLRNKKFEEDKDITDAKLKADAGSLSRYSMKFSLSYFGPRIGDLGEKYQPNPDGSVGSTATAVKGSINAVYRFNSESTLSMGTGLSALTPFHGIQRMDTSDPYLTYGRTSKLGGVQMRNSVGASYVTTYNYRQVGEYGGLSYDSSLVYNIGTSRVSVGTDLSLSYYLYSRDYEAKDGKAVQSTIGLYPQIKYSFTDKLSVNTSVALGWWNLRRRENPWLFENRTLSQRVGLGWAFRRDIYFSPYLNFYPERLATNTTTFNFSTVFSVL